MQRAPKALLKSGAQFEATLAAQLIMLAPLAPHFASECWYRLASAVNKVDSCPSGIDWTKDVLQQKWPEVDMDYNLDYTIYVNGEEAKVLKVPRRSLDDLQEAEAVATALADPEVVQAMNSNSMKFARFKSFPGCQADLYISVKRPSKKKS